MSEDYIMGKNPVVEALKSEREINKIWIAEGSKSVDKCNRLLRWQKKPHVLYNLYRRKKLME